MHTKVPRFTLAIQAIDEELRGHQFRSPDAERLRFARWVLTADDDQIDEAIASLFIPAIPNPALEDEGIEGVWDDAKSSNAGLRRWIHRSPSPRLTSTHRYGFLPKSRSA